MQNSPLLTETQCGLRHHEIKLQPHVRTLGYSGKYIKVHSFESGYKSRIFWKHLEKSYFILPGQIVCSCPSVSPLAVIASNKWQRWSIFRNRLKLILISLGAAYQYSGNLVLHQFWGVVCCWIGRIPDSLSSAFFAWNSIPQVAIRFYYLLLRILLLLLLLMLLLLLWIWQTLFFKINAKQTHLSGHAQNAGWPGPINSKRVKTWHFSQHVYMVFDICGKAPVCLPSPQEPSAKRI